MTKYEECEQCYFHDREPAICDECDDGDQFEPDDMPEDSMETLRKLMKPGAKIIPIARFSEEDVRRAEEEKLREAA